MPATFHFYLREDQPNKKGLCSVYLRITHNRKMKYQNTGIKILPGQWHQENERVRRSHPTYNKLNQDLDIIQENAQQAYRELESNNKASASAIKTRLKGASSDNFFTLSDEYLKHLKYEKQYHTHKQSKVPFEKLRKFHGSSELPLSMIDVAFMERFQSHLRNDYDNKASTIRKNLGAIRAVLDKAAKAHLITENPLRSDEFTLVKRNKAAYKPKLSLEQIKKLEKAKVNPGSNRFHARNAFVASFYFCGMRFGDIATLTWENVRGGRLRYKMNKTGNPIDIKITDGAQSIIDYYDHTDKKDADFVFPFLSGLTKDERKERMIVQPKISSANVIVNDRIKKVAKQKDVQISESLSMHVARHSFAQYGADEKEIPTYKMMMLLGHQNIKTTQQYLKTISVKTVDATMEEIF